MKYKTIILRIYINTPGSIPPFTVSNKLVNDCRVTKTPLIKRTIKEITIGYTGDNGGFDLQQIESIKNEYRLELKNTIYGVRVYKF